MRVGVWGLECRVRGLGFAIEGLGFGVWGLGFSVQSWGESKGRRESSGRIFLEGQRKIFFFKLVLGVRGSEVTLRARRA